MMKLFNFLSNLTDEVHCMWKIAINKLESIKKMSSDEDEINSIIIRGLKQLSLKIWMRWFLIII